MRRGNGCAKMTVQPIGSSEPMKDAVLVSTESAVLYYKSVEGLLAAETFLVGEDGKVTLVLCHYAVA